ncbi:uncharacterized protein C20orf204 homolog [Tenrec ecaudatus]|uniref:uncharacterized protein C20orf204 homolog n=1 Tax=Tenrec ecaudatus TaxID=94439 RepID=UPI003F59E806
MGKAQSLRCPLPVFPVVSPWLALCVLLLALPGAGASPKGLLVCSVPDVLRHYRAVIFEDLHAAEDSILVSIASLGRTLRGAASQGRRGPLEKAAWTVALRTEAVMRRHCWVAHQRNSRRLPTRPVRRRGSQRRLLGRALEAVATCWEKLFALSARPAPAPARPRPRPRPSRGPPPHRASAEEQERWGPPSPRSEPPKAAPPPPSPASHGWGTGIGIHGDLNKRSW